MKPIPFNEATDMAPLPFLQAHLELARALKDHGLPWKPHVGCFVWDHEGHIEAQSPFPLRVYFILSLPRFISIFGSLDAVAQKLVWVPTWHQARLLAAHLGVDAMEIANIWSPKSRVPAGEELLGMYRLILKKLQTNG